MAPETAVYQSSNFVILKFYRKVYFSDTQACQGLHLFPLCDVMWWWCDDVDKLLLVFSTYWLIDDSVLAGIFSY